MIRKIKTIELQLSLLFAHLGVHDLGRVEMTECKGQVAGSIGREPTHVARRRALPIRRL